MNKNFVIAIIAVILLVGGYKFFGSKNARVEQSNLASQSKDNSKSSKSAHTADAKKPSGDPNPPPTAEDMKIDTPAILSAREAYKKKIDSIPFEQEGPFEYSTQGISKEEIINDFARGTVEDGMVYKVNYDQLRSHFVAGSTFEMPILGGKSVRIYPKKVIEKTGSATIFVGSTAEPGSINPGEEAFNEVELIFSNNKLLTGRFHSKENAFAITKGQYGFYMLKLSPDVRID